MRAPNTGRGDLDQRMTVSVKNGEERYFYTGNMPYEVAAKGLAKWILGGTIAQGATADRLLAVGVDKGRHWLLNSRGEQDQQFFAKVLHGQPVQPTDKQLLICARDIILYNTGRHDLAENPVATMHLRLLPSNGGLSSDGVALELRYLDATVPEVAGILHLISEMRLKRTYDSESRELMRRLPSPSNAPKQPQQSPKRTDDDSLTSSSLRKMWAKYS